MPIEPMTIETGTIETGTIEPMPIEPMTIETGKLSRILQPRIDLSRQTHSRSSNRGKISVRRGG